ncbi:hypothetical protein CCH79_00007419, partial [Gambusia affinis]
MAEKRKASQICWLLLVALQITAPSAAQDATTSSADSTDTSAPKNISGYWTLPIDVKVAVGEPAEFRCGVPEASKSLTFTFYSSRGNYTLTCPNGKVEDEPQALYGHCEVKGGELVAIWTLKGTSYSDNDTLVVCHRSNGPEDCSAVLHVYDNGASYAVLIGCVIGGFFGVLVVFGLIFLLMPKSMTIQNCLDEDDTNDDLDSI